MAITPLSSCVFSYIYCCNSVWVRERICWINSQSVKLPGRDISIKRKNRELLFIVSRNRKACYLYRYGKIVPFAVYFIPVPIWIYIGGERNNRPWWHSLVYAYGDYAITRLARQTQMRECFVSTERKVIWSVGLFESTSGCYCKLTRI